MMFKRKSPTTLAAATIMVFSIILATVALMSPVIPQARAEISYYQNGDACPPGMATAVSTDTASLLDRDIIRPIPDLGIVSSALQEARDLCSRLCDLCDRTGDVDSCDLCKRRCSEITALPPSNP